MNCAGAVRGYIFHAGFNPHSPLLANEFRAGGTGLQQIAVSIHIRHCWRMNYHIDGHLRLDDVFQSTFAIAGE